jgi:hypothetical protein
MAGGGYHFETLFATVAVSMNTQPAPWLRIGFGSLWQPDFCDVTAGASSSISTQCGSDAKLGASLNVGVRWRITRRLAIGPEAAYVQEIPHRGRFAILAAGLTLRWH